VPPMLFEWSPTLVLSGGHMARVAPIKHRADKLVDLSF
jgi:hypothetical protein